MWRADRQDDFLLEIEETESDSVPAHQQVTSPHALSLGDPRYKAVNVAEPTWAGWREQLSTVGGSNPAAAFHRRAAHPHRTRRDASGRPRAVHHRQDHPALQPDPRRPRAARPRSSPPTRSPPRASSWRPRAASTPSTWASASPSGSTTATTSARPSCCARSPSAATARDFELRLRGAAVPQPGARARARRAVPASPSTPQALRRPRATTTASFKPNPVIDRLRGLTSHLEWFNVQPRLVVSSFADVATGMVTDVAQLEHPVLDALAGNPSAKWSVEESFTPVELQGPDHRTPQTDTLLLDADAEQENVIAQIAAGNSVVVKTLPGTGGTQTIVNAIGALVAQNKRVLVVSARRATPAGHRGAARRHRPGRCRRRPRHAAPGPHPLHRSQREGQAAGRSPRSMKRSCGSARC